MRIPCHVFLALILVSVACSPVLAQVVDYEIEGLEELGSARASQVFVLEDDVVLETGAFFTVRDYAGSDGPIWRGRFETDLDRFFDVLVGEDVVIVLPDANGLASLRLYSRSGVLLEPVGSLGGNEFTSGALVGDVALLAAGAVITSYDVSDPANPAFLQAFIAQASNPSRGFTRVGDVMFYADGDELGRLDVSTPTAMVALASLAVAGDAIDAVAAAGDELHLLVRNEGATPTLDLVTLDASGAGDPVETARVELVAGEDVSGADLEADGGLLIAVTGDGRVRAFDRTVPTAPAAGWVIERDAIDVTLSSSRLFIETADLVETYQRPDASIAPEDPYRRWKDTGLVEIIGDGPIALALPGSTSGSPRLLDLTDPSQPIVGEPVDVAVDGLFLADRGDLALLLEFTGNPSYDARLIDVSDPSAPVVGAAVGLPVDSLPSIFLAKPTAAITEGAAWVSVQGPFGFEVFALDLADPANPVQIPLGMPMEGIVVAGDDDTLIINDAGGLEIWDVSDPRAPTRLSFFRFNDDILQGVLQDDYAYLLGLPALGSGATLTWVLDLRNPTMPTYGDRLAVETGFAVQLIEPAPNGFILAGENQLEVFDTTDRGAPVRRAALRGSGRIDDVLLWGDRLTTVPNLDVYRDTSVVLATSAEIPRVDVLRVEAPSPNPFNPSTSIAFTLDRPARLQVVVYDVRGRRVARLADGEFGAARHRVTWDGTDVAGRAVASGVYMFRVSGGGFDVTRRATLVK